MSGIPNIRYSTSLVLEGAAEVLRQPPGALPFLRHNRADELTLEPGSVRIDGSRISAFPIDGNEATVDCSGCAIVPGFVDCHTHLPFAGWRAGEYAMKVAGEPYEDIAAAGGGIRSSAAALAAASDGEVLDQAAELAREMLHHGTTTLELKSGYGLSVDAELRLLNLADALSERIAQSTSVTALLAHAVPDGFTAESWMDEVQWMMPLVATRSTARALDIFVESVAFSNKHLRRMGGLAREYGLQLRAHVEQLETHGSVPVAIKAKARSVDHLSCLPESDIPALAASNTAAVLLPGAEFMNAERIAPGRALADAGAICVLATDFNPGTSPILSMPLIAGLAVRHYGWTVKEALLAMTLNAAFVLGLSDRIGSIAPGRRADLVLLDGPTSMLAYRFGHNPVAAVFSSGRPIWIRPDQRWRFPIELLFDMGELE